MPKDLTEGRTRCRTCRSSTGRAALGERTLCAARRTSRVSGSPCDYDSSAPKLAGRCGGSVGIVTAVRQEEIWDLEAAQRHDTPGTGLFAPEVLGPTVDCLAELAGDGRALELAIGTGRVAVLLVERAISVTGIELSRPMIQRLRTKADEASILVVVGDMATTRAPGEYALVYLVYNTISNLLTQAERSVNHRTVPEADGSLPQVSRDRPASRWPRAVF